MWCWLAKALTKQQTKLNFQVIFFFFTDWILSGTKTRLLHCLYSGVHKKWSAICAIYSSRDLLLFLRVAWALSYFSVILGGGHTPPAPHPPLWIRHCLEWFLKSQQRPDNFLVSWVQSRSKLWGQQNREFKSLLKTSTNKLKTLYFHVFVFANNFKKMHLSCNFPVIFTQFHSFLTTHSTHLVGTEHLDW